MQSKKSRKKLLEKSSDKFILSEDDNFFLITHREKILFYVGAMFLNLDVNDPPTLGLYGDSEEVKFIERIGFYNTMSVLNDTKK